MNDGSGVAIAYCLFAPWRRELNAIAEGEGPHLRLVDRHTAQPGWIVGDEFSVFPADREQILLCIDLDDGGVCLGREPDGVAAPEITNSIADLIRSGYFSVLAR